MNITYDRFEPLIKLPETKGGKGFEHITCSECKKVMMVWHICYKKDLEPSRHILKEKDVCHWCWDNYLKESVEAAGY